MSSDEGDFKKFKDDIEVNDSEDKKENSKQKFLTLKRKPKDEVYKDCKFDLSHLFYINHKVQRYVSHGLLPNMTLEKDIVQDSMDLPKYNYPYFEMSEPCPIYIAKKHCERVDPCFRRTINRTYYKSRLSQIRTCYQNTLKSNRHMRKLEKQNAYCPLVFTFAEKLECNPDPYFYGNYDYYYTGGNLCVFSNENQYIMHVDDMDSSKIRVSTFPSEPNSSSFYLEDFATYRLSNKSDIFEITPLVDINEQRNNIVAVRQRDNITVLKMAPESKNIRPLTEFKSKSTPFISFAQSVDNPEMFVLTTMKENVRVYDISRNDVNITNGLKMQKDKGPISWNSIKFWKNQSFLYASERQLCVMDFRTQQEDWLKTSCTFSSKEYPCEFISSVAISEFENLFYVGTSHKLRCLDTRYLGKKGILDNLSVCEWTHQLDYPPLLLNLYHSRKREFIALASPIAGDLRLCQLTRALNADCLTESVYKSYCLPWQPPTLQETYGSACLAGKTLQPEADFKQRVHCCTTGLAFYSEKPNKRDFMLWANSNGDIYAQRMRKRLLNSSDMRTSQRSNQIMADYAATVSELTQHDLNYTDMADFKAMRKVLLSNVLTGDLSKTEEEPSDLKENVSKWKRFKGSWQKSMATLHSYKDALAQDLLSIWDIPKEDEIDIKFSELKKKFKQEKDKKDILKWLNSDEIPMPVTSIPVSNIKMSSTEFDNNEFLTSGNMSQPALNESDLANVSANLFEMDYSMVDYSPAHKKPKTAKSKKKHVKGF